MTTGDPKGNGVSFHVQAQSGQVFVRGCAPGSGPDFGPSQGCVFPLCAGSCGTSYFGGKGLFSGWGKGHGCGDSCNTGCGDPCNTCNTCAPACQTKCVKVWVPCCVTECVPVCKTRCVTECVPVCKKVCTYK